ncbi:MAG: hypothetical protein A2452_10250 [Candidatus Firestonebacteria bacterium RIFOXYC2_FULL_39_67]|nr:MAG: hypothetical protein A2536_06620 [Candidatus Firestonebacteria bacterium RIFOXYD2_FULL_39_29]OGF54285.1 MAG: hypothetical protein A2452_10250 [Candidatus Firestonebacteria bacterium RIFOXYC2_FULL_39_67]
MAGKCPPQAKKTVYKDRKLSGLYDAMPKKTRSSLSVRVSAEISPLADPPIFWADELAENLA